MKFRCPSTRVACALLMLVLLPSAARLRAQTNNFNGGRTSNGTTGGGVGNTQARGNGGASAPNSSTASSTRTYRNATQLGDALIQIDPESRSLIVVADEDTDKEITKVIKNLDRPKPQVLIKVLFAQVTLDNNLDFGVEGNYAFDINKPATSQLVTAAAQQAASTAAAAIIPTPTNGRAGSGSNFGLASAANQSNGAFFTLNTQNATATLYALAQRGKVSVLSRPSILARNNQEAVILIGQSVPLPSGNVISDTGANTTQVQYTDVGIILRVTTYITSNRNIEMIVSPEISSLAQQSVQISQNFSAPIINKTSAETVVVTPDQSTVVIGGLMQKTDSTQINKVPLLGDIPYVGNLFKRTTKTFNKNELIIFMTPYIVEGTDHLEDLSVDSANHSDIPQEGFKGNDVEQFLDNNLALFPKTASPGSAMTTTKTRSTTTTTITAQRAMPVNK